MGVKSTIKIGLLVAASAATAHGQTIAGSALFFDGVQTYAHIPDADQLRFPAGQSMTLEFWAEPYSENYGGPISKREYVDCACGALIGTRFNASELGAFLRDQNDVETDLLAGNDVYQPGVWTHVALVRDAQAGTMSLYVNGALATAQPAPPGDITPHLDVYLGVENYEGLNGWYLGSLDEMRLWNVARTPEQIQAYFNQVITDPQNAAGLVGYWKFDEDIDSQRVVDSSAYGDHGVLGADENPGSDDAQRIPSTAPLTCYADMDGSGKLNLFDFLGYQNFFLQGLAVADCDGNGILDLFDFLCFVNAFNAGC